MSNGLARDLTFRFANDAKEHLEFRSPRTQVQVQRPQRRRAALETHRTLSLRHADVRLAQNPSALAAFPAPFRRKSSAAFRAREGDGHERDDTVDRAIIHSPYDRALAILSSSIAVRRTQLIVTVALLLSSLAGCQLRAPAGRYDKDGIAFDHLAGWSVVKDTQKTARTIVVEGPQHAVITLSSFPPNLKVSLETFIDAATKARAAGVKERLGVVGGAEADTTSTSRTERSILGARVFGLEQHFAVELLNARVPHTVEYFLTRIDSRTMIFMDQAPDTHRAAVDAGFQRIFDTVAVGR
jgi:hypothetical protein